MFPEKKHFDRADNAMQAYRGALGELREDMQVSPFASWTLEQLQVHFSTFTVVMFCLISFARRAESSGVLRMGTRRSTFKKTVICM